MRHYSILRLLIACFLLYIALARIDLSSVSATIFWSVWLVFFWLIAGANLATALTISRPPVMEQERVRQQ